MNTEEIESNSDPHRWGVTLVHAAVIASVSATGMACADPLPPRVAPTPSTTALALTDGPVFPTDPTIHKQWSFGQPNGVDTHVVTAWSMIDAIPSSDKASEVRVAVVGFGVDTDGDQPEFDNGQLITGIHGQDQILDDNGSLGSDPYDTLAWHETMAAGIIAADNNDGSYVAGMANVVDSSNPVKVMPIRVKNVDDEILRVLDEMMPYGREFGILELIDGIDFSGIIFSPAYSMDGPDGPFSLDCRTIGGLPDDANLDEQVPTPASISSAFWLAALAGQIPLDEIPTEMTRSHVYLHEYLEAYAADRPEPTSPGLAPAVVVAALWMAHDAIDKEFNLRSMFTAACAVELNRGIIQRITRSANATEKFINAAAIAYVFAETDFNDPLLADVADDIDDAVRGLSWEDLLDLDGDPLEVIENWVTLLELAHAAEFIVFDAFYKNRAPSSLLDPAELVRRYRGAIELAVDSGAKVINLGQGIHTTSGLMDMILGTGPYAGQTVQDALDGAIAYAQSRDVIIVTAVGNHCSSEITDYPANAARRFPNIVNVASINAKGHLAVDDSSFIEIAPDIFSLENATCNDAEWGNHTNWGPDAHVAAPGSGIVSSAGVQQLVPVGSIGYVNVPRSETNFAAPHVSAALVLGMVAKPGLPASDYIDALMNGVATNDHMSRLIDGDGDGTGDYTTVVAGGYLDVAGMLEQLGITRPDGNANSAYPKAAFQVVVDGEGVERPTRHTHVIDYTNDNRALTLQIVPSSGAAATHYLWDFGDGEAAMVPAEVTTVTHQYAQVGDYNVTLTAYVGELADVSVPQAVSMSAPSDAPYLKWTTFDFGGFWTCHSPDFTEIDRWEGVIEEEPGCSDKYWFLDASHEGIWQSGGAIRSCGKFYDQKLGEMLSYGIDVHYESFWWWRHRLVITDEDGNTLRDRDFRELKCGTRAENDYHRVYSLRDVIHVYNPSLL